MVPESVMPNYPWLQERMLDPDGIVARMKAMRVLGVPYSDKDIEAAAAKVEGKTEMDAMVAYMQVLGTMARLDHGVVYRE
jgi:cytochrome c oxidase cbb3-type subunit 2